MKGKPLYVTQPQLPPLEEFIPYLEQIWQSKTLTNCGPIHEQLEQALCEYLGVNHIALFANGTIALMTALKALNVTGEVITTPYTFIATTHAIKWCGCTPVFVDIDPITFNLDPAKVEAAITKNTTAILPVHCYGLPCDNKAIKSIAEHNNLHVVYDAAHAFSIKDQKGSILNHGDMSVLSFHATKVFNTFEGGAIICKDKETLERINQLKNHGIVNQVTVEEVGINGKLSEVAAAFGLTQMPYIDDAMNSRKIIDSFYRHELKAVTGLECLPLSTTSTSNYSYFPILINHEYPLSREGLYQELLNQEIYSRRYFYPLTSNFKMYSGLPSAESSNLPIATQMSDQVLCLPIFSGMTEGQAKCVTNIIRDYK